MSGFFGVLQDSDSSSDDDEKPKRSGTVDHGLLPTPGRNPQQSLPATMTSEPRLPPPAKQHNIHIPSYEDLSTSRADEETVLQAVYAQDFRRQVGVWGCARLEVDVRPPDIDPEQIGSHLW
jgi:hypothetical protein